MVSKGHAAARVFDAYAQKHGAFGLRGAISGGQYARSDGVFFGSRTPSWRNRTIRATACKELSVVRRVGVIDFHTGLGPFGHGELICANARRVARGVGLGQRGVVDDGSGRRQSLPVRAAGVFQRGPGLDAGQAGLQPGGDAGGHLGEN